MARSISDRPRGKRPVLFSRRSNSTLLSAASTSAAEGPSAAMRVSTPDMIPMAAGASAGSQPLSPQEKYICRSSSSRPVPARSSPRPDSSRARRRGEVGRPVSTCSSISKLSAASWSTAWGSSQFTVNMPWASGPAAKRSVRSRGAAKGACSPISESTGWAVNPARASSSTASRSGSGSSP